MNFVDDRFVLPLPGLSLIRFFAENLLFFGCLLLRLC